MRRCLVALVAGMVLMASCSEDDGIYDPYDNWQVRNAEWYRQIVDSARTSIAQAKALYPEGEWQKHSEWMMFKTLLKSQSYDTGNYNDSICVRVVSRGEHFMDADFMPQYTDSARLSYRGWLMPTIYKRYNDRGEEVDSLMQLVFTQTYYGAYNESTSASMKMSIAGTIEGYSTALQWMTPGDDWVVYIPQQLGYGGTANDVIPAYSTLQFRLHVVSTTK